MTDKLPKFIVIKSIFCSGYARPEINETLPVILRWFDTYVCCQEKSVFSPFAKIEVEAAKIGRNYVHLRFCHTNKYWRRLGDRIFPDSNQPEEDKSALSCTLFEPTFDNEGLLYLTHVESRRLLRTDSASNRVWAGDKCELGDLSRDYAFTFVDWDALVKIPKRVTFKGDNGKYLQAVWYDGTPWKTGRPNMQFSGSDGNHEYAAYEVHLHPDGHVRIKSEHLGKFWRRSPNWIWGDSTDDNGRDIDTLFWPVKVDSRTIALRNAGNNKFCSRLTTEGKVDCLNAAVSRITTEARLVVEELVLERNIYNVRYQMEYARVYDEQPFVAGIGTASNESNTEASLTIKVAYEDTRSYSFNNSVSLKIGIKTTMQTGLPFIANGNIEISAEVTTTFEWQRTIEEKKIAEATYTVKVPGRSRVKVNYVGTHGKCSVPFSYTQRDQSSSDGRHITSQHIDGVFSGVNYYSFRFEQLAIESLDPSSHDNRPSHAIDSPGSQLNPLFRNLLLVSFFVILWFSYHTSK